MLLFFYSEVREENNRNKRPSMPPLTPHNFAHDSALNECFDRVWSQVRWKVHGGEWCRHNVSNASNDIDTPSHLCIDSNCVSFTFYWFQIVQTLTGLLKLYLQVRAKKGMHMHNIVINCNKFFFFSTFFYLNCFYSGFALTGEIFFIT